MFYDDERQYNCTLEERCKFNVNIRAVVKDYEVLCRQQLYESRIDHHHGRGLLDSTTTHALNPMATASAMPPKPAPRNLLVSRTIGSLKNQSKQFVDNGLPISDRFVNINQNAVDNRDSQVPPNINKLMSCYNLQKQLIGQTKSRPTTTNIPGKPQQQERELQQQQQSQQQRQSQLNSEETIDSDHSSDDDTEDSVDAKNKKAKVSLRNLYSIQSTYSLYQYTNIRAILNCATAR